MQDKKFPDWFIDSLYLEEDKERARNNTLHLNDVLYFKCPKGHITKCKLASKIFVKTMQLKAVLCPECHKAEKIENCKKAKAKNRTYPQWFIDELVHEEDKEKARNNTLQGRDVVEISCPKGHVSTKRVCDRIKKNGEPNLGCQQCNLMNGDKSIKSIVYPQWFIDELVHEKDKELARIGKLPRTKKVEIECPTCGHHYIRYVRLEIDGETKERLRVCPKCMLKTKDYNHKKHELDYPQWFIDQIVDPKVKQEAIDKTLTAKREVEFCCPNGHLFKRIVANYITITTMQQRTECPICKNKNKKEILASNRKYPQWFIDDLYLEKDKELARNGFLKTTDTVEFLCSSCGNSYTARVGDHIKTSTQEKRFGCPACGIKTSTLKRTQTLNQQRSYPEWFIEEIANEDDKQKALRKELKSTDLVELKCKKGHIYKQLVSNHISLQTGKRRSICPVCSSHRSKTELEIEEYIQFLGFNTEHKKWTVSKNPRRYLETDIYIPEKNIGIEYNGSYFHKTLPKDKYSRERMYHQNKYFDCQQLGIRLISIFEPDWRDRKEKIKQYFKDLLLPVQTKIYARKTEVKKIDYHTANSLYDKYHLLGKTTVQAVSYGLYYNNELLACMSFQKGRYKENKEPVWCLTRFVTVSGYSIVGGASKLLKQFEKEYTPTKLVSYSDNDYFNGGVYSKLGFACIGPTHSPRYYWWLEDREIKREKAQLHKLEKKFPELYQESLSVEGNREDYIMLHIGAWKVYRAGHIKWEKEYYGSNKDKE